MNIEFLKQAYNLGAEQAHQDFNAAQPEQDGSMTDAALGALAVGVPAAVVGGLSGAAGGTMVKEVANKILDKLSTKLIHAGAILGAGLGAGYGAQKFMGNESPSFGDIALTGLGALGGILAGKRLKNLSSALGGTSKLSPQLLGLLGGLGGGVGGTLLGAKISKSL